jgi:hypothetical protein
MENQFLIACIALFKTALEKHYLSLLHTTIVLSHRSYQFYENGFQRRTFYFLSVSELSPTSAASF